jgi:hypothetical protein
MVVEMSQFVRVEEFRRKLEKRFQMPLSTLYLIVLE